MEKTKLTTIIIAVLLATNFLSAFFYFMQKSEVAELRKNERAATVNAGVVMFSRDFIETVLRAKTEVDFETRLKLENEVRDLKDPEILTQWGKFVNSKTEEEAQEEVKNLLGILMKKIQL